MTFDDKIKFYGTYRQYQQRVLDNLERFLSNEKIHVVAAPGSGKTILGLELIKRLDNVSLILVPSIAIREQWIERFTSNFLENKNEASSWISNDIKVFRPIMCITYQAFYYAYKSENMDIVDDDGNIEKSDYQNFNMFEMIKKYNVKTLCLDECHHLKLEWWKALEAFTKMVDGLKIIALTATPPYDSNIQEWNRYIELCGPIDDEIFVPELIKDNNLCPHQDFVYFSYPRENEKLDIYKYYSAGIKFFDKLTNDERFIKLIKSNNIYKKYRNFEKLFYSNEQYYRALVCFLYLKKVKIPLLVKMLVKIEKFDHNMLDDLLQNVLYDDQESYEDKEYITYLRKTLATLGMVHNKKVSILANEKINKIITSSLSKLDSIRYILEHEKRNNKDIRCAILTDYIKEKDKISIGNDKKEITSFGTIPIFEYLRRSNIKDVKLCCLTGTICIVPKEAIAYLYNGYSFTKINNTDYYEISVGVNARKKLVLELTTLFKDGVFNVVIGTKSLLGEGWDSPCIDTLIIASFIGSYVLSNQIRGRAIRKYQNKVANIWHLATLDPFDYHFSHDYDNLVKRFDSFVGIDYENRQIENGIERLGLYDVPKSYKETNNFNVKALEEATKKKEVEDIWSDCINRAKKIEYLTKITKISRKRFKKDYTFYAYLISSVLFMGLTFVSYNISYVIENKILASIISYGLMIIFGMFSLLYLCRIIILGNPELKLRWLSKVLLRSLKKIDIITSKSVKIVVKRAKMNDTAVYLENATTYEQNIFSTCLIQMIGPVDNPRYLICAPKNIRREFYVVPDMFKKNKNLASIFHNETRLVLGPSKLLFAKGEGKNEAIKAEQMYYQKYKNVKVKSSSRLLLKKN